MFNNKYIAITIDDVEIDLSRASNNSQHQLMTVIRPGQGESLVLNQAFVASLSADIAAFIPSDLSIEIKDVLVASSGSAKVLSASFGVNIDIKNLPLAGSMLPKNLDFSIEDFQIIYCTGAFDQTSTGYLNAILPQGIMPLPDKLSKGINFSVIINQGTTKQALNLPFSTVTQNSATIQSTNQANTTSGPGGTTLPMASQSLMPAWFTINKTFGGLKIYKIGVALQNGNLNFLFDASLSLGPLVMGFDQLQIGSPLNDFDPRFGLKGLSLDYHNSGLSIGGAFLRSKDKQGNDEYSGMFTLSLTKLQLTAIGSYDDTPGSPSLFIYGLLDEPLGGPPFFFVEGLAIAFGYNRNFIAPPVTAIHNFPLIPDATGTTAPGGTSDLSAMLTALNEYIPPQPGEYFAGIGIKFMSFKVINSFVLLIVKFGNELEFDLLGQTTYAAPAPTDKDPISVVQLDIVGSYKPAQGTLLIRGQLTPTSYVLSKKCHLEGGFAVAMWFKGNYSGDFVYSFGGYSSHYQPPAHYPQNIPQLGFLWQVDSSVSIKGGGYWALTPKEIMLGGYLKAVYESSWVKASFDIDAYFLVSWSPLHYEAGFSVSFSLQIKIDLLFISGWIGFELSESLRLHGPPFGGAAGINLWVCKVWIDFGAGDTPKPLLSGWEFTKAFLPPPTGTNSTRQFLNLNIDEGLVKKETDTDGTEIYFVNPKELLITTGSVVPCNYFNLNGKTLTSINFEIVPMGVAFDGTINQSAHKVTISKENKTTPSTQFSVTVSEARNAPKSMWRASNSATDDTADDMLSKLVFGTVITPAQPLQVGYTSSVNRSVLANENFNGNSFDWQKTNSFNTQPKQASSLSVSNLGTGMFADLQTLFNFTDNTISDYDGLQSRLNGMGDTKIFVGTLNKAS